MLKFQSFVSGLLYFMTLLLVSLSLPIGATTVAGESGVAERTFQLQFDFGSQAQFDLANDFVWVVATELDSSRRSEFVLSAASDAYLAPTKNSSYLAGHAAQGGLFRAESLGDSIDLWAAVGEADMELELEPAAKVEPIYEPGSEGTFGLTPESVGFGRRLGVDFLALAKEPGSWKKRQWKRVGAAVVVIGATYALDDEIRRLVRTDTSNGSRQLAESIRPIGQEVGILSMGLLALSGKTLGKPRMQAVGEDGIQAVLFSAGVVTPLLKQALGRARPRTGASPDTFGVGDQSFPSGEATEVFALAAVVAAHSDKKWVDALAWSTASLVSWQRMRLDAHWASDIVAGAIIGTTVGRWVVRRRGLAGKGRVDWSIQPSVGVRHASASVKLQF